MQAQTVVNTLVVLTFGHETRLIPPPAKTTTAVFPLQVLHFSSLQLLYVKSWCHSPRRSRQGVTFPPTPSQDKTALL